MKNKYLISLVLMSFLVFPFVAKAEEMSARLKGRILLQVEANGEAWYVNPENEERYYMGRPEDAFQLMRTLGLGVSDADFDRFNEVAPLRLSGRILLKVEDKGQAYYVNPVDLKMHYLGRPDDAFAVMRNLGLGITNNNLNMIQVRAGHGIMEEAVGEESEVVVPEIPTTEEIVPPVVDKPEEIATSTEEVPVVVEDEVFPTCEFNAEYFKNIELLGYPILIQTETGINHEWWTGKPDGTNYNNEFSVRWIGACDFNAGRYEFTAAFDDAMRVYVDDELIIDSWEKIFDEKTVKAEIELTKGKHNIKVEYYEYKLNASAKLDWVKL